MARPSRLRTPEGAWYSNYQGYHRHRQGKDEFVDPHFENEEERWKSELYQKKLDHTKNDHEQQPEMSTQYERSGGLGGRPPLYERDGYMYGRRPSRGNEYMGERGLDMKTVKFQSNRNIMLGGQPRSEWEREWEPSNGLSPRRGQVEPNRYEPTTTNNPQASPLTQRKTVPIWERDRVQGQDEGQGYGSPTPAQNEYMGVRGYPKQQSTGLWNTGQRTEWEREWQPSSDMTPRRPAFDLQEQQPKASPPPSPGRRGREPDNVFGSKRSEWEREWQPPSDLSPRKNGPNTGGYDPSFLKPSSPRRGADNGLGAPSQGQGDRYAGTDLQDYDYMKNMFSKGLDPRLAMKAEAQARPAEVDKFKGKPRGAFMFIRFPLGRGENVHNVEKWCVQAKPHNMGGQFIGISRRVFDYGYSKEPDEGCAVFQFSSIKNAQVFFDSDQRLKQPDFPPPQGHADIFTIEMDEIPPNLKVYDTFLYSEITLNDGLSDASLAQYEVAFREPFQQLLEDAQFDCKPYVCYSTMPEIDRKMHRKHFFGPKVIVTVHLFRGPAELEELMKDKRYSQLRSVHNALAQEKCSIFTVGRSACP